MVIGGAVAAALWEDENNNSGNRKLQMNLDLLRCTHVECRRAGPIPAKYLLETSYRVFFLYAGTVKQEAAFLHLTTWSPPERKSENQPTIRLPYCSSLVAEAPSVLRVRGGGRIDK